MASVDWLKMTTQRAGSMIKHNSQEARFEAEHSNPDIDKELTSLNYTIGAPDYKDMLKALKKRINEVDKKHPPLRMKADRITCCMLVAPCPLEIQKAGKEKEFFEEMQKVYEDFFGRENVLGSCIHYDEQHEYIDKDGSRKMSLVHAHTLVAAYAEWEDKDGKARAGINGKNFMTKARLTGLNKAMCRMVKKTFGVDYNTGAEPRKEKTEKMKADSLRAEVAELKSTVTDLEEQRSLLIIPKDTELKKGFLESQRAYDERVEIEETKKALEQEKERLVAKEAKLEENYSEKAAGLSCEKEKLEAEYASRKNLLDKRESKIRRALNKVFRWLKARLTPKQKEAGRKHYFYRNVLTQKARERFRTRDYEKMQIHFPEGKHIEKTYDKKR